MEDSKPFREITVRVDPILFNQLRISSIHQSVDVDAIVSNIVKQYYDSRKKD